MTEVDVLFDLYKTCFPNIVRDDDTVRKILSFPDNQFIFEKNGDVIVGAAVVNGGTILMLCVTPTFRNKGIGTMLLKLAEQCVLGNGFTEAKFCDGKDYITPGIPMAGAYAGNEKFFIKHGYVHSWEDSECVDMAMKLADFNATEKVVGDTVNGVLYRWGEKDDLENVLECVEAGCPEFVEYYKDDFLYEASASFEERALLAIKDDKVCGALLVGNGSDMPGLGSVGCTVTHPDYQKQGIATTMVMLGTHYLQSLGLKNAFLGYTYTDIIPMYGRSGYKVCMKYFMGVKKL